MGGMAVALVSECNAKCNFYQRLGFRRSTTPIWSLEWTRPDESISESQAWRIKNDVLGSPSVSTNPNGW